MAIGGGQSRVLVRLIVYFRLHVLLSNSSLTSIIVDFCLLSIFEMCYYIIVVTTVLFVRPRRLSTTWTWTKSNTIVKVKSSGVLIYTVKSVGLRNNKLFVNKTI